MTDTATARAGAAAARPAHPLDPASAAEYLAGREILAAAGLLGESVRIAYYGLEGPAKGQVLTLAGWAAGRPSPAHPTGPPAPPPPPPPSPPPPRPSPPLTRPPTPRPS